MSVFLQKQLPNYCIPIHLKYALSARDAPILKPLLKCSKKQKFQYLLKELEKIDHLEVAKCHYLQFLKIGLYLEEFQQRKDMKPFELTESIIQEVEIKKRKFKIYVKDIDKNNSVLNPTDTLKVYNPWGGNIFLLRVRQIEKDYIHVTASKRFRKNYNCTIKYNVVLVFNDYTFQNCHRAIDMVTPNMIRNYLFPEKSTNIQCIINDIKLWIHEEVSKDREQRKAVVNILNKTALPIPYILYGPPGTGKTTTLIEVVCQIWLQTDDYILICTPSNAACDVIIKRLILSNFIPISNICRVYNQSHDYSTIDDAIKKCCNFDHSGSAIQLEKVANMSSKRIIATTLASSSRLKLLQLPFSFSYIFIDEAGQATQPEYLIPLDANNQKCQIILSGDPQQLGPVIHSKLAEPILGESILQKLMKHEPYKKHVNTGYNSRYITKLLRNYRSDADIIHIPNVLFYDNELITCKHKDEEINFPIMFDVVYGREKKIPESESVFNNNEVNRVLDYVKNLIGRTLRGRVLKETDIGVVTPFTLQVLKIRKQLEEAGLENIKVGTVETFQGREKEVIIVSTVRSKIYLHDTYEHIGLLSNPRRFNVALTRAKSYLIVIGNPRVLQTNKYWRCFLQFCDENDAFRGQNFVLLKAINDLYKDLDIACKSKLSTDIFNENIKLVPIKDGIYPPQMRTSTIIHNNSHIPYCKRRNPSSKPSSCRWWRSS